MSSRTRTLYIGVTNDLMRRLDEHQSGAFEGFTTKYKIYRLVYFEQHDDVGMAIAREKQLKSWRREKKLALIRNLIRIGLISVSNCGVARRNRFALIPRLRQPPLGMTN
jgi:putative endonuclease